MSRAQWFAGLALFCLACGPEYEEMKFTVITTPPTPVSVESDNIRIPVGIAVWVEAKPISKKTRYPSETRVTLRSADADLLGAYATTKRNQFVLVGLREGSTCLDIKIDNSEKECIDVSVLPQEE